MPIKNKTTFVEKVSFETKNKSRFPMCINTSENGSFLSNNSSILPNFAKVFSLLNLNKKLIYTEVKLIFGFFYQKLLLRQRR